MSKAQRNGAGRRDPEKLKRQKRRDRLFLAFLTFLNFLLALIVRIADRKSVIKAVKQDDKLALLLEEKTTKSLLNTLTLGSVYVNMIEPLTVG